MFELEHWSETEQEQHQIGKTGNTLTRTRSMLSHRNPWKHHTVYSMRFLYNIQPQTVVCGSCVPTDIWLCQLPTHCIMLSEQNRLIHSDSFIISALLTKFKDSNRYFWLWLLVVFLFYSLHILLYDHPYILPTANVLDNNMSTDEYRFWFIVILTILGYYRMYNHSSKIQTDICVIYIIRN